MSEEEKKYVPVENLKGEMRKEKIKRFLVKVGDKAKQGYYVLKDKSGNMKIIVKRAVNESKPKIAKFKKQIKPYLKRVGHNLERQYSSSKRPSRRKKSKRINKKHEDYFSSNFGGGII